MNDNQVIIIGAGLAGLSTGCYAQMNGYQSQIFEHHTQPGGVAAAWRREGYLIDGGIHFFWNHRPGTGLYEMYRELGIVPDVQFLDMETYGLFVDESAGIEVEVTRDLDRLARDLKELSPADGRIIDDLIKAARAMQGLDMSQVGLGKPPELMSPLDQLRDLWAMRRMLPYAMGKYGQPTADYARGAQAPWLRSLLENLFLPEAPVYFICMILALLADGQMGFVDGSCLEVVHALARRYKALGGTITYRAKVEEILVERDRAVGVRLGDGSEHRAEAVVSAADGYSTIFHMLGGRYVNDKIRQRYETWPRFRPLLMASYGVAREFPGEPSFCTISLKNPFTIGHQEVAGIMGRIFNYSDKFAPPGKSVIQVELETEWDYWNDLQQSDRAAYDAEKARVATEALLRLEARYPGLSSQVEVTDVVTPYTFWRYTLNDKGAWEGWLMTPDAMRTLVERTLPGLDRFFMAGQWVTPGGGVPPVLYTGQHAVQLLCRQDGKTFSTTGRQVA
jgi:phytoene dehydrogenase-like protein